MVQADRYHYAAPFALTVLICLALAQLKVALAPTVRVRNLALSAWLVGLAVALVTARPAIAHSDSARELADKALANMQHLIDSAPPGEDVYIQNRPFLGVGPFVIYVPRNFPGWAALFVVYHASNVVDGPRVFFVEPNADVRDAAGRGVRSATLLVPPETGQP